MKNLSLMFVAVAALGMAGQGAAGERDQIQRIAREAGVTPQDVRMVLGARTAFAQYRTSYDRKEKLVHAAMVTLALEEQKRDDKVAERAVASK